jgi:transposase
VKEALATRDPDDDRPVLIMAEDEGRFGRLNDPRRAWAPDDIRPISPQQIVREYVYVFAAVAPKVGRMSALILPFANTEMMNLFLEHLGRDFKDFFALVLIDQAGWHVSNELKVPENIRLIPLPPHSPELNPSEHIWDEVREKGFINQVFPSLDEVEQRLCRELVALENDPARIRSMTNFPYLDVTL